MDKKILLTTITLSTIIAGWSYAMYGNWQMLNEQMWNEQQWWCHMMENNNMFKTMINSAPENIKTIILKRHSGQNLTDQEMETLRNYMMKNNNMFNTMMKDAPENIKAIILKRHSGQNLTDQEMETLRNYMMKEKFNKYRYKNNKHKSNVYKSIIEEKYWEKLNKMSEEKLKNIQAKIKKLLTKIEDSKTYTELQKRKYLEILWALDIIIREKLAEKDSSLNIIDSLFNK